MEFGVSNSTAGLPLNLPDGKMTKTPIRILVVDDRAAVRDSLRTILTLEEDFEVIGEAANGREAVEAARTLQPDLVLMDLEMPDPAGQPFDGISACASIKHDQLCQAVIILTVHADQFSRQRAQAAGVDLFLEKGVTSFELLNQVRRLAHPL